MRYIVRHHLLFLFMMNFLFFFQPSQVPCDNVRQRTF